MLDGGDRTPYLARLVLRLAQGGVAMHYAGDARRKDFPALEAAGVPCAHLPIRHKLDFFARARLRRLLRELRIDLLHTVTGRDAYQGVRARGRGRCPAVAARRGAYPKISRFDPADRFVYGRRGADRFFAVSRDLERHMVARGIAPARVRTIYTGVWSDALRAEPWDPRAQFAIPPERFLAGFLGNVRPVKGVDLLLHALAATRGRGAGTHLLLVGEDHRGRTARAVRRLGLGDRVTLPGYREEAWRYLPGLDALVVPSRIDALPRTAIEATVLGVPVLGTRVGGVPEILDDGRCGWLVPSGDPQAMADALLAMEKDAPERRARAARARERNRDLFSVDRCAEEHAAAYRDTLDALP